MQPASNDIHSSVERKLAAIMFTDIVGYTRMMGADEKQALKILRKSRTIHLDNIEKYKGWFIKEMGDGVLAQFDSALQATLCARDIQLEAINLICKIRIGIHYGEVTVENDDVFGNGVNIASRLQSAADPGGVFISSRVYQEIEKNCDILFEPIGDILLKNVKNPVTTLAIADKGFPKTTRRRKKVLTGSDTIEAIAVLPFDDLSEDPGQQYFVDGMHDALITEISQIKSLRVISRTSTLRYRNTIQSVLEIGEELGVDAIIEATVLKHEDKVRIQVQLVKVVEAEDHLWAHSYDRELKNVFEMYHEVVKDVAGQIDVTLTKSESEQLEVAYVVDPNAYEAYLQGMYHWTKLSKESLNRSLDYFTEAVKLDPQFAPAYTGVASAWGGKVQMGHISPSVALPNIYKNLYKSISLDDNIADSYFFRATHSVWMDWDWDKGYKSFQKALEINPNYAICRAYFSHLLAILGRKEEALSEIEFSIQLDPFNVLHESLYGMVLNYTRRYQRAEAVLLNILNENKTHPVALSTLRSVYFNLGELNKSYEIFKKSYVEKGEYEFAVVLQEGFKKGGYESALVGVAELKIASSDKRYNTPWQIATLYTRAGRKDKALEFLKKAYEIRDPNMPYLGIDPIFDNLKGEVAYNEILHEMNLPNVKNI